MLKKIITYILILNNFSLNFSILWNRTVFFFFLQDLLLIELVAPIYDIQQNSQIPILFG